MATKKRKKTHPKHLSPEEQSELGWSLNDLPFKENSRDLISCEIREFDPIDNSTCISKRKKRRFTKIVEEDETRLIIKTSLPELWHCVLGSITIILNNVEASTSKSGGFSPTCRLVVDLETLLNSEARSEDQSKSLPDKLSNLMMEGRALIPDYLQDALLYLQNKKLLCFVLSTSSSILDPSWDVMICLFESVLTNINFASQETTIRKADKMVQCVMEYFYPNKPLVLDTDSSIDNHGFDGLYKEVMDRKMSCQSKNLISTQNVQHPKLIPTLRGYQKRAVRWMIHREKGDTGQIQGQLYGHVRRVVYIIE